MTGGMRQSSQNRQQQEAQQKQAEQQAANQAKNLDAYNRAYGACLEGKGYTVK